MSADQRIKAVLPYVSGRLLDIGCGTNTLVRAYANLPRSTGAAAEAGGIGANPVA